MFARSVPGWSARRRPGMTVCISSISSLQHHETALLPVQAPRAPLRASGARRGLSRSFHGFDRATRRHGAALLVAQPAAAGGLHCRDLRQRAAAVLGAAAVHQDGAAAARRLAGGVVGGDGVLPVAAAGGLRLCASPDADQEPIVPVVVHLVLLVAGLRHAAARHRHRLWRATGVGLCVLAARPVRGLDRPAVLRARRQQSAAAGLVRPHRPSCRTRSLFPLCILQHRQLPRAVVLSVPAGADFHAAHAEPVLDPWLWPPDPPDRRLRRAAAAFAEAGRGRRKPRTVNAPAPTW